MTVKGKKFLIVGVANDNSIAWGISQELANQGAELAFTYLNEALEKRVRPLAESVGSKVCLKLDVQSDADIESCFAQLKEQWGTIDGVLHCIAFADKNDLAKPFSQTSRAGFQLALDVSAYSLIAVTRAAMPLMSQGGSVLTLTYLGAERVIPNYNVMGVAKAALEASVRYLAADVGQHNIRVNAISAGPIRTLAAYGIPHFKDMLTAFSEKAPLRRNITQEDVGKVGAFYFSDAAAAITGEVTYVDAGFNIVGM